MPAIRNLLGPQREKLVNQVRDLLGDVRAALVRLEVSPEDETRVRDSIRQLEDLFLLVVVGEFNAGKSAFVNALAGERILEEGVTPTTTRIQVLRHGEQFERTSVNGSVDLITAPVPLLKDIHIVDTPGTNAIERRHEAITQEYVPRADLVFFVTSADRPFTESERAFLEKIREWGKKIVVVINKIDILESPEDLVRIETFVGQNFERLLGVVPEIFPLAARVAFHAKQRGQQDELARSRFDALEEYIQNKLDEEERFRLKILNPLGVGLHLVYRYDGVISSRLEILKQDLETIETIQNEFAIYKDDMQRGFRLRLADVQNVLHELEARGEEFFEDTIRLPRFLDLINRSKIKADFEKKVVGDAPTLIEKRVEDIIDWMVSSELRQWQNVRDQLARRRTEHSERVAGQMAGGFDYDRVRLLETVGRAAQQTLEHYDKSAEANRMAESVQAAVAGAALMEVGAVGLGAAVSMLASTTAADITGMLAAGLLAALGFFVIPQKRRTAKKELRERIAALREQLMSSLNGQFNREIDRSVFKLDEAMAPYTRFVRGERDRLEASREELKALEYNMTQVKIEVSA